MLFRSGVAVKLLLAEEEDEAVALARELDQLNSLRKELGRKIMAELTPVPGQPLVAYSPHWHQGVIGIAAGQIAGDNMAPAILMTDSRQGGSIVGSARSVEGINIYAVFLRCQDYLEKFGGHPAAAGFSLLPENLEGFTALAQRLLAEEMDRWFAPELNVDLVLKPGEINLDLVEELSSLSPCGEGNPRPLLYCENLSLKSVRAAGSGQIMTLGDRRHSFAAGLWRGRPVPGPGGSIGAVFTVAEDIYRGERSVWATVQAWWPGHEQPVLKTEGYEYSDCRGLPWRQVLKKYPGAGIYREGVKWQDYPGNTRNNLGANEVLVLLTPPPSPEILRQVLAMAEPGLVVLGYAPEKGQNFLLELLGAVKYILSQEAGEVSLSGLAAALGANEEAILAAFRLLSVSGIIQYQLLEGKLVLQRLKGTKIKRGPEAEHLRRLLEETRAFQNWLQQAKVEDIKKIRI